MILDLLLPVLFPKAPAWLLAVLVEGVPVIMDAVDELRDVPELEGAEKASLVIRVAGQAFDDGFDDIPEWSEISEERRDRILSGMTELALFVLEASDKNDDGDTSPREVRKAFKGIRANVRRSLRATPGVLPTS